MFRLALSTMMLFALPAQAVPFHDKIPEIFHGIWAPSLASCKDPEGVEQVFIDAESVNYYEANDYLLIGVRFAGGTTKSDTGELFNGRFTSRSETMLLDENNIRFEIADNNRDVLYRYPLGDDGEPIEKNEVRSVRCQK